MHPYLFQAVPWGGGGGAAMNVDAGPANEGSESDGPAALAEPALASVCVKPAPCNLGLVRRMSFAGPDIVSTMLKRTTAQAL